VVSFTSQPLYPPGKEPLYPLDRRLGGLQSRSGRGGEEKNSQPLPGLEPPIIQPVAHRYTTEVSRLTNDEMRGGRNKSRPIIIYLNTFLDGLGKPAEDVTQNFQPSGRESSRGIQRMEQKYQLLSCDIR
jgi:hypothetical protein